MKNYTLINLILINLSPFPCGEDNIISITAEDEPGNRGTDTLTVNVGSCKPGGLAVR